MSSKSFNFFKTGSILMKMCFFVKIDEIRPFFLFSVNDLKKSDNGSQKFRLQSSICKSSCKQCIHMALVELPSPPWRQRQWKQLLHLLQKQNFENDCAHCSKIEHRHDYNVIHFISSDICEKHVLIINRHSNVVNNCAEIIVQLDVCNVTYIWAVYLWFSEVRNKMCRFVPKPCDKSMRSLYGAHEYTQKFPQRKAINHYLNILNNGFNMRLNSSDEVNEFKNSTIETKILVIIIFDSFKWFGLVWCLFFNFECHIFYIFPTFELLILKFPTISKNGRKVL